MKFPDLHFSRYYNNILVALHPLFGAGEDNGTRDNAAGAVARMITAKPHALPLNQVYTMTFHYINHLIYVINSVSVFCYAEGISWYFTFESILEMVPSASKAYE